MSKILRVSMALVCSFWLAYSDSAWAQVPRTIEEQDAVFRQLMQKLGEIMRGPDDTSRYSSEDLAKIRQGNKRIQDLVPELTRQHTELMQSHGRDADPGQYNEIFQKELPTQSTSPADISAPEVAIGGNRRNMCVRTPDDVPGCRGLDLEGHMRPGRIHGEYSMIMRTLREGRTKNPKLEELNAILVNQFSCGDDSWGLTVNCIAAILKTREMSTQQVAAESSRATARVIAGLEESFPGQGRRIYQTIDDQVKGFVQGLFGGAQGRPVDLQKSRQDWAKIQDWINKGYVEMPDEKTLQRIKIQLDVK